ncbi:hypothetical protein TNCV_1536031 [Trichonephila clavipes]|nr:hypothetical protein TNCV_1536031 [Trichonephila clavipes]
MALSDRAAPSSVKNWGRSHDKVCTNSSMTFSLQHQDSRVRVWWHRGERTLAASIRHRHSGPSPGVMDTGIVRTFLDTENVRLLPWSARSPDLSPIGNVWSLAAE